MASTERDWTQSPLLRFPVVAAAGIVIANVVAAALFDRDPGLGIDDLLVVLAGLGLAVAARLAIAVSRARGR